MDLFNDLRHMKILLIDDDEWIRDSLSLFFESESCSLTSLETAEEGIEALSKHDFDIIIIDYCLPGMDGLEFLVHIREKTTSAIKVLVTAYASKHLMEEASNVGVHYFISKPFTSETVESVLSKLIEYRKKLISEF